MKYKAFISYRHCEPDSDTAEKIIKTVERYGIPKTIVQKHHTEKKVGKLFRDIDELSAADDLTAAITEALDDSEYLIMVCSPRYVESKWCMLEVEHWINRNGRNNIIAVLLEGEPEEAFPKILTDYEENGEKVHVEPLAVDIRGENKKEILRNIDAQKFRVISSLIGCDYDDLRRRQQEVTKRTVTAVALSVLAVLSVIAGIILYSYYNISKKNAELNRARDELEQTNEQLVNSNSELTKQKQATERANGKLEKANKDLQAAKADSLEKLASIKYAEGNIFETAAYELAAIQTAEEAGINTQAMSASLSGYLNMYTCVRAIKMNSSPVDFLEFEVAKLTDPGDYTFSASGKYAMLCDGKTVGVLDVSTSRIVYYDSIRERENDTDLIPNSSSDFRYILAGDSKLVYISLGKYAEDEGGKVIITDLVTKEKKSYRSDGEIIDFLISDDKITLLTSYLTSGKIHAIDMDCNEIGEAEEIISPKKLIDENTVLCRENVYFRGGETKKHGLNLDNFKFKAYKSSPAIEYTYDKSKGGYVYDEKCYPNGFVTMLGNEIFCSYAADYYDREYKRLFPTTDFSEAALDGDSILLFNGEHKGNIAYAADPSRDEMVFCTDYAIWLVKYIDGNYYVKSLPYEQNTPIRKLILKDGWLLIVNYSKAPVLINYSNIEGEDLEYETLDLSVLETAEPDVQYDDAVISGNMIFLFSARSRKVDTFRINDRKDFEEIIIPDYKTNKYDYRRVDYDHCHISDYFPVLFFNGDWTQTKDGIWVQPKDSRYDHVFRFVNVHDNSFSAPLTPPHYDFINARANEEYERYYLSYNLPHYSDGNIIAGNEYIGSQNDVKWIITDAEEKMNAAADLAEYLPESTFDIDKTFLYDGKVFTVTGDKTGTVSSPDTGEALENVTFRSGSAVTWFFKKGDIQAERSEKYVRVFENGELIYEYATPPEYETKNSKVYAEMLSDAETLIIFDSEGGNIAYSLTKKKELLNIRSQFTADAVNNAHCPKYAVIEEATGRDCVLLSHQYLINTKNWKVMFDFADKIPDVRSDFNNFYFNEKLNAWCFAGIMAKSKVEELKELTLNFFSADKYEQLFSINYCLAASPDGNHFFRWSENESIGRIFLRVKIMDEHETVDRAYEILEQLGFPKEDVAKIIE